MASGEYTRGGEIAGVQIPPHRCAGHIGRDLVAAIEFLIEDAVSLCAKLGHQSLEDIGVLTGGGDCPGLNAVIRAIVRQGVILHGFEFIGFRDGWAGVELACSRASRPGYFLRYYQTTTGRALLAILLPIIVCCGGGFVLAWTSYAPSPEIFLREYAANGQAVAGQAVSRSE